MYMKYNLVLRAADEIGRKTKLTQSLQDMCHGNLYTTTLHAINSAIVKLSELLPKCKVYRGISGVDVPKALYKENEMGACGLVEFAFMSTTIDKHTAISYTQTSEDPNRVAMLFELDLTMMARGADLGWLSQYPAEKEARSALQRLRKAIVQATAATLLIRPCRARRCCFRR